MIITVLNRNNCKGEDKETIDWLRSVLQYPDVWWKKNYMGHMKPQKIVRYMVDVRGRFLSGFIDKVRETNRIQGKDLTIKNYSLLHEGLKYATPSLPGITLREDQLRLIEDAKKRRSGLIKAPTRSGKTVVAGGLISCLPNSRALFIVHTLDLLEQTVKEFKKFGFNVGAMGGGKVEASRMVTVATRQTFIKGLHTCPIDLYDLVIIDEAHHVVKLDGQYAKILNHLEPAIKIGFTATEPEKEGERLVMEGLLGPKIGELTQEEAKELKIIAETKVKIYTIPKDPLAHGIKTYKEAYPELIVRKRSRNKFIMDIAKEYLDNDETVLIIVRRVAHGFNIQDMFKKFMPDIEVPFLCGGIDSDSLTEMTRVKAQIKKLETSISFKHGKEKEEAKNSIYDLTTYLDTLKKMKDRIKDNSLRRGEYKDKLNNREIKCIIATNIFNEGVNIPTLNTIILAGAGKSETQTIQSGSRAFTKSPGKEYGTLIDLFDPNYVGFVEHFGYRIAMYCSLGWM